MAGSTNSGDATTTVNDTLPSTTKVQPDGEVMQNNIFDDPDVAFSPFHEDTVLKLS